MNTDNRPPNMNGIAEKNERVTKDESSWILNFAPNFWLCIFFVFFGNGVTSSSGDDNKANKASASSPVKHPELEHYSLLWEKSLFTSRALPKPPASGPSFADGLTLVGIYEIGGRKIAVVMDKATSQVIEVSSILDKTTGMQMLELDPGPSPYKARVQIQRGSETGWVGMADAMLSGPKSPDIRPGQSPAPAPAPPVEPAPPPANVQSLPAIPVTPPPSASFKPVPTEISGDAPLPP